MEGAVRSGKFENWGRASRWLDAGTHPTILGDTGFLDWVSWEIGVGRLGLIDRRTDPTIGVFRIFVSCLYHVNGSRLRMTA
jgi:hypothetical protein